jgi:hypothetical protein
LDRSTRRGAFTTGRSYSDHLASHGCSDQT